MGVEHSSLREVPLGRISEQEFPELTLLRIDPLESSRVLVVQLVGVAVATRGARGFGAIVVTGLVQARRGGVTSPHYTRDSVAFPKGDRGTPPLRSIRVSRSEQELLLRIEFWSGFGWLEATGHRVHAYLREGLGKETGKDQWTYLDTDSGESIDPATPFRELI
jgi:hypothetical protein